MKVGHQEKHTYPHTKTNLKHYKSSARWGNLDAMTTFWPDAPSLQFAEMDRAWNGAIVIAISWGFSAFCWLLWRIFCNFPTNKKFFFRLLKKMFALRSSALPPKGHTLMTIWIAFLVRISAPPLRCTHVGPLMKEDILSSRAENYWWMTGCFHDGMVRWLLPQSCLHR